MICSAPCCCRPIVLVLPRPASLSFTLERSEGGGSRVRLLARTTGSDRDSDMLIGQLIAVTNESFRKELGVPPAEVLERLDSKLRTVMRG